MYTQVDYTLTKTLSTRGFSQG